MVLCLRVRVHGVPNWQNFTWKPMWEKSESPDHKYQPCRCSSNEGLQPGEARRKPGHREHSYLKIHVLQEVTIFNTNKNTFLVSQRSCYPLCLHCILPYKTQEREKLTNCLFSLLQDHQIQPGEQTQLNLRRKNVVSFLLCMFWNNPNLINTCCTLKRAYDL